MSDKNKKEFHRTKRMPVIQRSSTTSSKNEIASIKQNNEIMPGYYLECFPAPRVKLNKLEEFVIGRESSCNLSLNSEDVSRQHAVIKWNIEEDSYIITDLQSVNGLLVNGVYCTTTALKDRDIIQIGEHKIYFYHISLVTPTKIYPGLQSKQVTVRKTREATFGQVENLFKGDLKVIDLGSVLQMVASKKKTGYVQVTEKEIRAFIYFERGIVVHSQVTDIKGEDAFFIIMGCENGKFVFVPDKQAPEQTMNDDVEYLLLQFAQSEDESQRDSN
ncbi:FHA domain-containing protein [Candidatus Uabimicrobium amorphum]|uniref:FHA domain-containing protein n=1 Tax=Uabimicrobium amorphum TaxID=2596890 RepID=A0A5S9IKD1_UABAM|nr:DUF4388 domain-containing protein [Candidatus Uabimicrobium amorphum]BBM83478.1 hypothetical protein UABAM_01830 [Candidatus Uabimicrobium amorphum]